MRPYSVRHRVSGQGLVEAALAVLAMVPALVGLLAVGRTIEAQSAVNVMAYEAARSAALANTPEEASALAQSRKDALGSAYRLSNGSLSVRIQAEDVRRGQPIVATASYQVDFSDIPLLGWVRREVSSRHTEHVEGYRSIVR